MNETSPAWVYNDTLLQPHLYQPSLDFDTIRIVLTILYLFLCAFGLTGNAWVICLIVYIFRTLKASMTPQWHTYIYVLSLCIVDSLVLSVLPLLAAKTLQDQWIFGWLACKIYYTTESINKILSTFILTGLSWDRYMAICHPLRPRFRTKRVAIGLVLTAAFSVALLLLPCTIYSETFTFSPNSTVYQCHLSLNARQLKIFVTYTFVLGFCVPALLMIFFYTSVLWKICGHVRNIGQTQISVRKITLSTLTVVGFYFACWTPYWIFQLLFVVSPDPPDLGGHEYFVPLMLTIHAMPYANSAFNWIFYALLNKQLRQTHDTAMEKQKQTRIKETIEKDFLLAQSQPLLEPGKGRIKTQKSKSLQNGPVEGSGPSGSAEDILKVFGGKKMAGVLNLNSGRSASFQCGQDCSRNGECSSRRSTDGIVSRIRSQESKILKKNQKECSLNRDLGAVEVEV